MTLQRLAIDFAPAPAPRGALWRSRVRPLVVPFLAAAALGAAWWLFRE